MSKPLLKLTVLLASLFLALALGEIVARAFLEPPLYSRYVSEDENRGIESEGLPDTGFYQDTPLGKRLRVDASGVVRNHYLSHIDVPLRTNEFGCRGPAVDFDRGLRVLFLGDSITLGDYLLEEDTFVARIGALSKDSATPLETINAGVGSIGLQEELNILREIGPRIEPHYVVLNLFLNDVQPSPALHLIPVPKWLRFSHLFQHLYQRASITRYEAASAQDEDWIPIEVERRWMAELAERYPPGPGDWRTERPAYNREMLEWFRDWGSAYSEGAQERMLEITDRIGAVSESLGARMLVVIHPTRFQVEAAFDASEPQRAFLEHFRHAGVPVLDLLPMFRERLASSSEPQFYDHCHHTVQGAAFVAGAMHAFLEQAIAVDRSASARR